MAVAELQTRSLPSLPAVVVLFALAAVSATWQLAVFPGPALGRYFESVAVARSLAAGHGFANPFGALENGPTAHVAPLFPLALGGLMHLFGDPRSFAFAAIGLCVFLHGLHAVLLLPLSRLLLADVRPGVWAALFTAVVPAIPVLPQWESIWSATGSMLFCLATARILRSRRPFWIKGAASGALCGVLLLLNPALVIVSGAWMAAFWFCERPPLTGWLVCALTFLAAAALVCLPWTLRNQRQLGGLFLVRDNLGIELYSSNADCAQARGDANKESGCHALMQANFNVREAALLRDMGEVPYNRSRLAIAIAWIRGHPARFRELTRRRFKEFWFPTPGEAENMMVDLQLTNRKLVERAKRIIVLATGVSYERASAILEQSGGHVKTAIVMAAAGIPRAEASNRIAQTGGTVRGAIAMTTGAGKKSEGPPGKTR